MARRREAQDEELRDEDYSSDEIEAHRPGAGDSGLEFDDRAYVLLEYINLEWPAQSIAVSDARVYLGTNPGPDAGAAELVEIDLRDADYENLKYRDGKVSRFINKIRVDGGIYAISDGHLTLFGGDLGAVREVEGRFGYGLAVAGDRVLAGTSDGRLQIYDRDLNLKESYKIHDGSIEAIAVKSGVVYTGSTDHTLRLTGPAGESVRVLKNDSDVNCLDVNGNGQLVYGDDSGRIHLVSTADFSSETIAWHETPVSFVRWKDDEVFASGSDEQVCLWDVSLVDEWDYHRYLLFVHQGQRLYKDVAFEGDLVITTSQDGLCVFTPVSFRDEDS